jgi:hypothetical protein
LAHAHDDDDDDDADDTDNDVISSLRWRIPATAKLPGHQRDLERISWAERTKLTLHYTNCK